MSPSATPAAAAPSWPGAPVAVAPEPRLAGDVWPGAAVAGLSRQGVPAAVGLLLRGGECERDWLEASPPGSGDHSRPELVPEPVPAGSCLGCSPAAPVPACCCLGCSPTPTPMPGPAPLLA